MSMKHQSLFEPFKIRDVEIQNRLAVAPMARVSATAEGDATEMMRDYYAGFATGGFGLIFTESLYTDNAYAKAYPFQPGIVDHKHAAAWRSITDAVHSNGAAIFAQLMHAGALAQGERFMEDTVGPSAVRPTGKQMPVYYGNGEYAVPRAMSETEIHAAMRGFVDSASLAVNEAGFDGVELHGANGYLMDQFLSYGINTRDDQWGGQLPARMKLMLDTIAAVKAAVGIHAPVGIRISQGKVNDFYYKWAGRESDAETIFGTLADAGVDFLHVTEFEAWKPAFANGQDSLAALARRFAPGVPLIVNGSLHDIERAEEVMGQGADLVTLGRGALANPDLPLRIQRGLGLREFDSGLLGPIANIKSSEIALRKA